MNEEHQRSIVRRIFVEKKKGFDVEAQDLFKELKATLGIDELKAIRILNRYDVMDITDEEYEATRFVIFFEPLVDHYYEEKVEVNPDDKHFYVEYLPGQYDQRADSVSQCIQFLTLGEKPRCKVAKLIVLEGDISSKDFEKIKTYCINPVDSREALIEKPESLDEKLEYPKDISQVTGFTSMGSDELSKLQEELGIAMSLEDLEFCRNYFADEEFRNPSITELRVIDTYWSDHCRHTTFLTSIDSVEFEEGPYSEFMKSVYDQYISSRKFVYASKEKDICLMDMATIVMKELLKRGKLEDLDVSSEINACSIVVNANIDGKDEEWLIMFKNETHNHPTEIEPFGGAATCLGGAIRDPLSGRSYVYQAMRVTGSGDPRGSIQDTLAGKLPQRKITTGAAQGYSYYGNQIGLATGHVTEIYDEGYVAKRMEIGAVIGAAPKKNVVRLEPETGDVVILLGGRTGRDGCGGATGSSKEHDEESLFTCGAEVQKGNPPTERKIQRLFRNPEVTRMIKRCNDFGAGGVSVAIGELSPGLDIDLNKVPVKYEGLDGTELAISESQERMAVVVSKGDAIKFISAAQDENLEATQVAVVTDTGRLKMTWRGEYIVDISRKFLDTNGVKQHADVKIMSPEKAELLIGEPSPNNGEPSLNQGEVSPIHQKKLRDSWVLNLQSLDCCSQKGLVEQFDSTVGASTVLMPFGGKHQLTPAEGMAAKLPVMAGDTITCTLMSHGFNPKISRWSPFHGAVYAVVEAVAKIAAMGGDYRKVRLTFQEYFEKLGKDPSRWGKPFSALLGAFFAQMKLGIPAIGGKDSMSGTFMDLDVPPTLVAFAVNVADARNVISTEFKKIGSHVVLLELNKDNNNLPIFEQLDENYVRVYELAKDGKLLSAHSVRNGGIAEAISKMCFGNMIGVDLIKLNNQNEWFYPNYGSIILEIDSDYNVENLLGGLKYKILGCTTSNQQITIGINREGTVLNSDQEGTVLNSDATSSIKANSTKTGGTVLELDMLVRKWQEPLEQVFPTNIDSSSIPQKTLSFVSNASSSRTVKNKHKIKYTHAKPRVFIPVFPGTNSEYDIVKAFENAGALTDVFIIKNLTPSDIKENIKIMKNKINQSQILMLSGGFNAGYEPGGSGKFIATVFGNPYLKDAVMNLLKEKDGLVLGICNGFQALIKLGLLPYGEISSINSGNTTITFNSMGNHISRMVRTKILSNKSPWFSNVKTGDIHTIAVSHGEGRFVATEDEIVKLAERGQIATQYVDLNDKASQEIKHNPNGSMYAIEGITSPDGRVLGKMGHSERIGSNVCKNVSGEKEQRIFESGVDYFI